MGQAELQPVQPDSPVGQKPQLLRSAVAQGRKQLYRSQLGPQVQKLMTVTQSGKDSPPLRRCCAEMLRLESVVLLSASLLRCFFFIAIAGFKNNLQTFTGDVVSVLAI
jgi:hypothetical protein